MKIRFLIAMISALSVSPASASCENEIGNALLKFWQSGPFQFDKLEWNINFRHQTSGIVVPGKAELVRSARTDGQGIIQTINKDDRSWTNDGFGWTGPVSTTWSHSTEVPGRTLPLLKARCFGKAKTLSSGLKKYQFWQDIFSNPDKSKTIVHSIYLDAATDRVVRYERKGTDETSINIVSTFRFDKTLKIETPVVDLKIRRERLLQKFDEIVEASDKACRSEILEIMETAQTISSFIYKITGELWSGVSDIRGKYVPPDSVSYLIKGVPYHGGGTEVRIIGLKAWYRPEGADWQVPNGIAASDLISHTTTPQLFPIDQLHIGATKCPVQKQSGDNDVLIYKYDQYTDSEYGRVLGQHIVMHVSRKNRLPVMFEIRDRESGEVVITETRSYLPNLKISEPISTHRPIQAFEFPNLKKVRSAIFGTNN